MRLLTPWSLSQGGACSRKSLLQAAWCGPPPFRASTLGLSLEGHVHLSLQELCFTQPDLVQDFSMPNLTRQRVYPHKTKAIVLAGATLVSFEKLKSHACPSHLWPLHRSGCGSGVCTSCALLAGLLGNAGLRGAGRNHAACAPHPAEQQLPHAVHAQHRVPAAVRAPGSGGGGSICCRPSVSHCQPLLWCEPSPSCVPSMASPRSEPSSLSSQ